MDRMKETAALREWLESKRGEIQKIALKSEISLRTIWSIMKVPDYQASVRIIRKLKDIQRKWK